MPFMPGTKQRTRLTNKPPQRDPVWPLGYEGVDIGTDLIRVASLGICANGA